MLHEMRKPALAGAGSQEVRSARRLNTSEDSRNAPDVQDVAAAIVAYRYRLSPRMARLFCHLAHIGGREA
jgi:hypothetical protein